MTSPLRLLRENSAFADDEAVIQSHPLVPHARVPGARVPRFGDTTAWDFNKAIRRPANLSVSKWVLCFSGALAEPGWNLLVRELCMAMANPQHPALSAVTVLLRPRPYNPATLIAAADDIRLLADWAREQGLGHELGRWHPSDVLRYFTHRQTKVAGATLATDVGTLKRLHALGPLLSAGTLADPWPRKTARQAVGVGAQEALSTDAVAPGLWFPLVKAAWAYVHTFAPDILRGQQRYRDIQAAADRRSVEGLDERLEQWLQAPGSQIPLHPARSPATRPQDVNWTLLTQLVGVHAGHRNNAFGTTWRTGQRRKARVTAALAAGHPTTTGVIDDLVQVTHADGSTGPWHRGLDPAALAAERVVLRNACFVLTVALSMMRDSEIHEIKRGAVVEHYGAPAIASTKQKLDAGLPTKHWWIIEPVANAIAVAEALSAETDRVFIPMAPDESFEAVQGGAMLDAFITHVNATCEWTGLAALPAGKARPHMFRRTMAMLTDQFAGSEIALGIQLKHVATRALANRSTQQYAAPDQQWAQYLDTAVQATRFRRIQDLYDDHKKGVPIGYGPGADRIKAVFDQIQETVKARGGDARVEHDLLRQAGISIRLGTLNHCLFNENEPSGALCLENAKIPEGHQGPLHDQCRPDRCGNSMIGVEHVPLYTAHRSRTLALLHTPRQPACRRELLQRELDRTDAVLAKVRTGPA